MTTFNEAVKIKIGSCAKCFSMTYTLPCTLDIKLASYLNSFGLPIYSVEVTKIIRIDSLDGFSIEGRVGNKSIKLTMPKKLEKVDPTKVTRRIEFEKCLTEWMSDKLNIEIEAV